MSAITYSKAWHTHHINIIIIHYEPLLTIVSQSVSMVDHWPSIISHLRFCHIAHHGVLLLTLHAGTGVCNECLDHRFHPAYRMLLSTCSTRTTRVQAEKRSVPTMSSVVRRRTWRAGLRRNELPTLTKEIAHAKLVAEQHEWSGQSSCIDHQNRWYGWASQAYLALQLLPHQNTLGVLPDLTLPMDLPISPCDFENSPHHCIAASAMLPISALRWRAAGCVMPMVSTPEATTTTHEDIRLSKRRAGHVDGQGTEPASSQTNHAVGYNQLLSSDQLAIINCNHHVGGYVLLNGYSPPNLAQLSIIITYPKCWLAIGYHHY